MATKTALVITIREGNNPARMASLISRIELSGADSPALCHEKEQALKNMMARGYFQPLNDNCGPYEIRLSIEENRLVIRLRNARAENLQTYALSLRPYRRLIQDYFMMIDSYEQARRNFSPEKLEALDMGRRGIHNDGAALLRERLKEKIDMDFETARGLFTLLCALHQKDLHLAS